ncbi:MAG TPA: PQQ-dependent sugar dehydrogenase [Polyangiaceae bacterium]|nr:PQQ-dependent sugar dehydrogenase [Polyangiaceae bacterium]
MNVRLLLVVLAVSGCEGCGGERASRDRPIADAAQPAPPETRATAEPPAARCQLVEEGYGPAGTVPIRVEVVAKGLEVPWGIAFLEGGNMLVSERPGRVVVVKPNGDVSPPIARPRVSPTGEAGLLGIALHPRFAQNRQFYIYLTGQSGNRDENRVERWTLSADATRADLDKVIIDGIPSALYHDGGRIRFGPDGMLYVGTGDARDPERSQDRDSLSGKILRLTPDGQVPPDNPVRGKAMFVSGVRNTQGFDWFDAKTLAVSDHGPSGEINGWDGHDEVSVARAGDDLGWPRVHGCDPRGGSVTPVLSFREAAPPGGAAFYTGSAIPEWKGALLVGTLRSKHLHLVRFDRDKSSVQKHEIYVTEFGRLRDVVMGPDGHLYVTTSNCDGRGGCGADKDRILRILK